MGHDLVDGSNLGVLTPMSVRLISVFVSFFIFFSPSHWQDSLDLKPADSSAVLICHVVTGSPASQQLFTFLDRLVIKWLCWFGFYPFWRAEMSQFADSEAISSVQHCIMMWFLGQTGTGSHIA
jgi:hypothetical protein